LKPAGSIFAPLSTACASTVWHAEAVVKPLSRFREVIRKRAGTTLPDVISEDSQNDYAQDRRDYRRGRYSSSDRCAEFLRRFCTRHHCVHIDNGSSRASVTEDGASAMLTVLRHH
jgi:hypothetical protein